MERAWPGWNWEAGEWGGTQLQVVAGAGEGCCRPCGEFLFQAGSSGGPLPGPRLILEEPLPLWAEWARQRQGGPGSGCNRAGPQGSVEPGASGPRGLVHLHP